MKRKTFELLENHMLSCMEDSAHDPLHVRRVLNLALKIAAGETGVNLDLLITSCLLHDIGRAAQNENPSLCHAEVGAAMAADFLHSQGFSEDFCQRVFHCISTHRFRGDNPPQSLEAKILFDADKLDVTGAMGIARTFLFQGLAGEQIYHIDPTGAIAEGGDIPPNFIDEYNFKLSNLYSKFYTKYAKDIAAKRQNTAVAFYNGLVDEITEDHSSGRELLESLFEE